MSLYTALQSESSAVYKCVGVCSHLGKTVSGGHYAAFARRGSSWYLFNDTVNTKVNESIVTSESAAREAYLIFYVKR